MTTDDVFSPEAVKRFTYFRQMQLYYEREAKRLNQEVHDLKEENALAKYILQQLSDQ